MARLAALHGRCAADGGALHAASVATGASSQPDRDLRGLPPARIDAPHRYGEAAAGLRTVAAQLNQPPVLDAEPPKPVQRWTASDYAKNGRFVQELAGAIFHMLAAKPESASSISAAATARSRRRSGRSAPMSLALI